MLSIPQSGKPPSTSGILLVCIAYQPWSWALSFEPYLDYQGFGSCWATSFFDFTSLFGRGPSYIWAHIGLLVTNLGLGLYGLGHIWTIRVLSFVGPLAFSTLRHCLVVGLLGFGPILGFG